MLSPTYLGPFPDSSPPRSVLGPKFTNYYIDSSCYRKEGQVNSSTCISRGFMLDPVWRIVGDSTLKYFALLRLKQLDTEPCGNERRE
jgi:hypothetical protein